MGSLPPGDLYPCLKRGGIEEEEEKNQTHFLKGQTVRIHLLP